MDYSNLKSIIITSVIFASLISGSFFTIRSTFNPSITGAVIGVNSYVSNNILIGTALFVLSLTLAYHFDRKKEL